jgi:uncharacterized protein (UPF0303 family)
MIAECREAAGMSVIEDLEQVTLQERELQWPRFNTQSAWELGVHLRTTALDRNCAVVIDVRRFGQPLFYTALEGTTPDNVEWVRRKSNLVARFHRSSYSIGLNLKLKNDTLSQRYALPDADYAAHGGSFPLAVTGAGVIGSVTVSGLPQRDDHEMVVEALCAMLERDYASLRLKGE